MKNGELLMEGLMWLFNPNLEVCVCVGGVNCCPPPCWFSLNNSKMVKAVMLAFCIIRDIRAKAGIRNSPQSSDSGQN